MGTVAIQLMRFFKLISRNMSYIFINIFILHLDQQKVNGLVLVPMYLNEENNCARNNVSTVDDYVLLS